MDTANQKLYGWEIRVADMRTRAVLMAALVCLLIMGALMVFEDLRQFASAAPQESDSPGQASDATIPPEDQNIPVFLPIIRQKKPVPSSAPTISSFTANPGVISPGGMSTLVWTVTGADSLRVEPGVGPVTGTSVPVWPTTRTDYTLTATNAFGSVTATTTVDLTGGDGGYSGKVWLPYRLSGGGLLPTYGASTAVDPQGGAHVAFGLLGNHDQAEGGLSAYGYCPGVCDQSQNWQYLHLGQSSEVRLALDPAGHPRLLFAVSGEITGFDRQRVAYVYATCDGNCSSATGWTFTTITEILDSIAWIGGRETQNNRYFALDSAGRPAFVYTRFEADDPYYGFLDYAVCIAQEIDACSQTDSWRVTTLDRTSFPDKMSFVFTAAGEPRIAYQVSNGIESALWYAGCNQGCLDPNNWAWSKIADTTYYETMTFSLRVDGQGRPRIGFYSGSYNQSPSPFADNQLYYLWCDVNCTVNGAGTWDGTTVGLPGYSGGGVDLVLDAQGRPRMAYEDNQDGLGYSWCNENCATPTAAWHHAVAESRDSLNDNYDVLPIRRCTISTWFSGVRPSLALDTQGHLRIGYDAQHYWYGTETVGGVTKTCNFKDINVTRFAAVNRPE